jgi:hypothetical protein
MIFNINMESLNEIITYIFRGGYYALNF